MSSLTLVSDAKCFDGQQRVYSHVSAVLNCKMNFGIYLPKTTLCDSKSKCPIVFFLSGLTCSEANFIQKSGFQRYAAQHSLVVVNPDTSPRGCKIEGDDESWDFGIGAGFYVDATESKWAQNYRMYTYVCEELPSLIFENFNVDTSKAGIMGHSMGGHGALLCALRNPDTFRCVSAFAPICNPTKCPWGQKAFGGYLGTDQANWKMYDSCNLAQTYSGPKMDILIDQGDEDQFYKEKQLLTENLTDVCASNAHLQCQTRYQKGYDHSYFFISTFIGDHMEFHAKRLNS